MIKVAIVGPKGVGKTTISNYLSGHSEKLSIEKYNPTAGVRILEFQTKLDGINENVNLEIWDASGDNT